MWWARGGNVSQWCRDQDEEKPDEKKIGMNRGMKESGSERTKKNKKKKNAIRTLRATRKEKKEKENERNKEKEKRKIENEEIYKGRNTHSPLPTALESKNKKKKIC